MVKSLSDIYPVGTFVQIHELQDMGNKLRIIVMAHRRINIVEKLSEEDIQNDSASKYIVCMPYDEFSSYVA